MRLALLGALCATLGLATPACGGDDDGSDLTNDAGDGDTADAGSGTEDAGSGGENDGGNQVELCGGFAGMQCTNESDYCDFEDGSCGAADALGACTPRPTECDDGGEPVCACGGLPYPSECEAAMDGRDVSSSDCATTLPR